MLDAQTFEKTDLNLKNTLLFTSSTRLKSKLLKNRFNIMSLSLSNKFRQISHQAQSIMKEISSISIIKLFLNDIKYKITCPETTLDCLLFHNEDNRNFFRKEIKNKSGIYMLKYKHDNRLFYIEKSVDLSTRLRDHFIRSSLAKNRLGVFLKMVGWSNISVHILEFCLETELDNRENFYIKKFLPTLNRKFSSLYSLKTYRSLSSLLNQRQSLNRIKNKRLNSKFNHKSPLWVYLYPDMVLLNNLPFDNISKFKKIFNIDNRTVYKYLDTYTPYNGYIFLSADIFNTLLPESSSNIMTSTEKMDLKQEDKNLMLFNSTITPSYKAIKIWVYKSEDLSLVSPSSLIKEKRSNDTLIPFNSISAASYFLNINPSTIKTLLNTKIANSKGYYFFDYIISDNLKKRIIIKS